MKRILLIDRQQWTLDLSKALYGELYEVTVVQEAENFMRYLHARHYDLVLLSYYLKYGYQSWDVIQSIKNDFPYLPVIILASNDKYIDTPIFQIADGYVVQGWSAARDLTGQVELMIKHKSTTNPRLSARPTWGCNAS